MADLNEFITAADASDKETIELVWVELVSDTETSNQDIARALEHLAANDRHSEMETIVWTYLTESKESADPQRCAHIARTALNLMPTSVTLREEYAATLKLAYKDNPFFNNILQLSGLETTNIPARRALRMLDTALNPPIDSYVIDPVEEVIGKVTNFDQVSMAVSMETSTGPRNVPLREYVRQFEPVDDDDFRVLVSLRPERLTELIQSAPEQLLISLAKKHGGSVTNDQVKFNLCPVHITKDQYSKWWTRARNAAKKSSNLRIEGRNPVIVHYEAKGITVENELMANVEQATNAQQIGQFVKAYIRDAKRAGSMIDESTVKTIHTRLLDIVRKHKADTDGIALAAAIEADELSQLAGHDALTTNATTTHLGESRDPINAIGNLNDTEMTRTAIATYRQQIGESWLETSQTLLELVPAAVVNDLVEEMITTDRIGTVQQLIDKAMATPVLYPDIIEWLWTIDSIEADITLPSRVQIFSALLTAAAGKDDHAATLSSDRMAYVRNRMRSALSSAGKKRFQNMLEELDAPLAATVRRQVARADGLGNNLPGELTRILNRKFPVKRQEIVIKPWEQEDIIYTTEAGLELKRTEFDELVNVKIPENARAIGAAAELGDLSENSEYQYALEERDLLRARQGQLGQELSQARLIKPTDIPPNGQVWIGSKVTLDTQDGGTLIMSILGPWEADVNKGIYNYKAPRCQAVLGKKVGDSVQLSIDGQEQTCTIRLVETAV